MISYVNIINHIHLCEYKRGYKRLLILFSPMSRVLWPYILKIQIWYEIEIEYGCEI